jgi:uncharacterized damage-inducible protein DinB
MTTATEKTSALVSLVRNYTNYNLWAHETIVSWLKTKPVDVMDKEVASSFPSIKQTLIHIWDTQRFWLSVINQTPFPQSFRMGYEGTLDDVLEGIVNHSKDLACFVQSLNETELSKVIELKTPWFESDGTIFEYIQHVVNHSSYHRGQLITIGRNVDLTDAPMTDFNYYLVYLKQK